MSATVERESGMLDVGTHCAFCRQLDFLPFHCTYCNSDFCSSHRSKESHHCKWLIETNKKSPPTVAKVKDNNGKYFKSLMPEKGYIRVQQDKKESTKPQRIRSNGNRSALDKLTRFFKRKEASKKTSKSKPNAMIQLTKLKRSAQGDDKIPMANRLYVYCYAIDDDQDESKELEIYINKIRPVGGALDSIAKQLNVSNRNSDFNATSKEKLFLYKKDSKSGELICLDPSDRVVTEIKDLDTLYLVRGDDKI